MALLIGLLAWQGFTKMGSAVAATGWGFLAVGVFYIVPLTTGTLCWRSLQHPKHRLSFTTLLRIRWISGAVNKLVPAGQIGAEFVRARLALLRGVPGSEAGASVVVDVTVGVATQVIFTLLGILLLFLIDGYGDTLFAAILGVAIFGFLIFTFYLTQRGGLFLKLTRTFERLVNVDKWGSALGGAGALDEAVAATYRRRGDFARAFSWRLLGWILGSGEIWIALYFLGHPISLFEAIMLESLGLAVRNAAFMVPGALGVQEGGFMLLGTLAGLPPDMGLALSLVLRVRELLIGIPALLAWHYTEGIRILARES